ncbi:MAG TPA: LCP family protein, partial [Mycobacterium sp.]|nr:LCP family protein [Mycobacterium sp.]
MSDGDHAAPGAAPGRRRGSHAEGALTVAELIARVGGTGVANGPSHRRAAPEPEDSERWHDRDIADIAYASELPDLNRIHHAPASAGPAERRPAAGRPGPIRVLPTPEAIPRSGPRSRYRMPARRRVLLAGRAAAALLAVLALALTGGAWQWSTSKNNSLNKVSALDPESRDIVDPGGQYGDENFLIVGTDTRAGANSNVGAGDTEDAGGSRSDTIMLVNIPANRKRVVVVSFPRDLAITPLYCQAWNSDTGAYGPLYYEETGTYGSNMVYTETKLNSTYAFGGPKCLVKEIQKLSGLAINRFMAVDFVGFGKMVDALGGVEVCTTAPIYDYELGTVLDRAGRQTIDASTALNYVRARNVSTESNGDYGRIKRQQLFLSSLLRSLISKDTFFSLSKLNNVVDMFISESYVDNIKTRDLVGLGQSLQGVSAGHITFVTVPTGETDENGDEPPRISDMRALFEAIIDDDPLPGENGQNATSTPTTAASPTTPPSPLAQSHSQQMRAVTTAPYDVTVRVSNATGEPGLAANASDELEQAGFNVMTPDDYAGGPKATTVLFSPGNEQAAATVASALANPPIERVSGMGEVVRVVLGPDFHSVGTPAPSGSSVNVQLTHST